MGLAHVRAAVGLAFALAPWLAGPAVAHDQAFSKAEIRWNGDRIALTVALHPEDARALDRGRPGDLPHAVAAGLVVRDGGRPLPLESRGGSIPPSAGWFVVAFQARASGAATLAVDWNLFPPSAQHETYLKVLAGDRLVRQEVLTAEHPRVLLYRGDRRGAAAAFVRYVAEGIHHIAIGPDHVLFVVGLVLLGGGVLRIAKVATAFTAAHSVTLALAALGAFRPPAAVVEPLIALSIVCVGADNLRARRGGRDWRVPIAFAFGLVHGFGFASVLSEVGLPREALAWSLFGFNVGVEAGQLVIVLLIAPVLGLLTRRTPELGARVVATGSLAIAAAGGFWFVERVASSF